jgi:xanthine dehydrogenase accessory factor
MRRDLLAELRRDLAAKRPAVVATWMNGGESVLLHPDDTDPAPGVDPAVVAAAREAALDDESRTVETGGGPVFLRVYNPPVRLVVVGAVHVSQALAPMARLAGYDVVVVDPRRAFASEERFRGVEVTREWPDDALARLGVDRRTALVTMTHDPKIDDPALVAALRSDAFYVGALGSRKTQAARRDRLRELGLSEAQVARIDGPVGLSIGSVSPGEIAVSILAQLVARLRLRRGSEKPPDR